MGGCRATLSGDWVYRVLDLGGTAYSWLNAPLQPKAVTLLNLFESELKARHEDDKLPDWLSLVAGDACEPPPEIREADFDLVFSNSLIGGLLQSCTWGGGIGVPVSSHTFPEFSARTTWRLSRMGHW